MFGDNLKDPQWKVPPFDRVILRLKPEVFDCWKVRHYRMSCVHMHMLVIHIVGVSLLLVLAIHIVRVSSIRNPASLLRSRRRKGPKRRQAMKRSQFGFLAEAV